MRYLSLSEVLEIHRLVISQAGGSAFVRDLGALESALAQPRQTFGGEDLYPGLADKACALAFSLILNHPFSDGNKRVGHAAMSTFIRANGGDLKAPVDEAEQIILGVAAGKLGRDEFLKWIRSRTTNA